MASVAALKDWGTATIPVRASIALAVAKMVQLLEVGRRWVTAMEALWLDLDPGSRPAWRFR